VPKATKRERQRQNRDARRAAMQEAEKRRKRNRTIRNLTLLLIPFVILFVVLQVTSSDDSDNSGASTKRTFSNPPPQTIDPTAKYTATIDTSQGTIDVDLDAAKFPVAVNNFVFLARQKFYDGLLVNRAAKDFVFQTGSPSNTQAGGPGYSVQGEVPTTTPAYPVGSVAFGKNSADAAGTAGSQFFVVTGGANPDLPAQYAFLGTVTQGLDVAQKISDLAPASGDGTPTKKVTVTKVTITETPAAATTTTPVTTAAP
jgi:cyclophilin family peptidyl-prolyl cis-trans isomerase